MSIQTKHFLSGALAIVIALAVPASVAAGNLSKTADTQKTSRGAEARRNFLIKEIRHEVVMLPFYSVFDNISFTLDGGKVTLLGQVVRPTLKDQIEKEVKEIEGVESVTNKIEVLPVSPNDDRLRRQLYRAIYGDATLFRYSLQAVPPIHIIVNRGHVTLEGVVSSESEKNVAGIRANGVSSVFGVTNNLRVER